MYNPEELDVLYSFFKPDIVQIPYSIIDNRFEKSKWIDKMYEDGVEIHIRSIFFKDYFYLILKNYQQSLLNTKNFLKVLNTGLALTKFQSYKPV